MTNDVYDDYLEHRLSLEYVKEKAGLDKSITGIKSELLKQYITLFPFHFISYWRLKNFIKELSRLRLLPSKEEYIKLHKENEFFEIQIEILWGKNDSAILLRFPYSVNINIITELLAENHAPKRVIEVSILKELITPECFDEFDSHMLAKKQGHDMLDKIKAKNPIIVMGKGDISKPYLINGNHRTIQAIRDKKENIDGYIVDAPLCKCCGITYDYEKLFFLLERLYNKMYGVQKSD